MEPFPVSPHPMEIDCGYCVIRDWRAGDEASLVAAANNRNVWRNLDDRFPHPYTNEHARAWLILQSKTAEPSHWAIEVDGFAVGGVGIDIGVEFDSTRARLGYWLAEPYWGKGIMTPVVRSVANYALSRWNLERIDALVFAWNRASMRVLEKSGFLREETLPRSAFKDGQLIDQVRFVRMKR